MNLLTFSRLFSTLIMLLFISACSTSYQKNWGEIKSIDDERIYITAPQDKFDFLTIITSALEEEGFKFVEIENQASAILNFGRACGRDLFYNICARVSIYIRDTSSGKITCEFHLERGSSHVNKQTREIAKTLKETCYE